MGTARSERETTIARASGEKQDGSKFVKIRMKPSTARRERSARRSGRSSSLRTPGSEADDAGGGKRGDEGGEGAGRVEGAEDEGSGLVEDPAVAGGGGRCGGAGCPDGRYDEKPVRVHRPAQLPRHVRPEVAGQNDDDGNLAPQQKLEDVPFQRALEAAHDAMVALPRLLRPFVALHHVGGGHPPRREKRHLVRKVKKRRVTDQMEEM